MRKMGWLSAMLLASAAVGCGGETNNNTPPADVAPTEDTTPAEDTSPQTDGPRADGPRTDGGGTDVRDAAVATDGPASRAGAACTMPDPMGGMDPACGDDMVCIETGTTPICTNPDGCENNSSQAMERGMCGGTGSTCLTQGDGDTARSICTASCRPTAMTVAAGSCRPGFVCTGWWYTHTGGTADSPGCFGFCSQNSDCPMGETCNVRTGSCGMAGHDMTRQADGTACNPMMTVVPPGEMTARNIQCRGICFGWSNTDRTQGICGSFVNTRTSTACPDDPDSIEPLGRSGADNLAICLIRSCRNNGDCRSPLICAYPEDAMGVPQTMAATRCQFATTAQRTGIPATMGDGGVPTDVPAPTDVPRTDVPAGG